MKFNVTPELTILMRTLRMQNNISAKDLAAHLGKSPSYISKLESGMVKSVEKDTLTSILKYISEGEDFYNEILPNLFRVLGSFMEEEKISAQTWLLQYDVVERNVMIPEEMRADLTEKMNSLQTSISEIVEFTNENIDSEMSTAFPTNQIVSVKYQGSDRLLFRAEISHKEVRNIFEIKKYVTGVMTLNNVVYTLFRFAMYGKERKKMPPDLATQVLRSTARYTEQYGVSSLISFPQLTSSDEYVQRQTQLISNYNTAGRELISDISDFFEEAFSKNALNTAKVLKNVTDMISWDPAFTMKILGLPFTDIEGLSYQKKKRLLEEIVELLNKYDGLSDFEKKWEEY